MRQTSGVHLQGRVRSVRSAKGREKNCALSVSALVFLSLPLGCLCDRQDGQLKGQMKECTQQAKSSAAN